MVPWLYTALRTAFQHGVRFYFLDMQIEGEEHVGHGPLILASNHPNSVLDALVLGVVVERPIGFLARAGLFKGLAGPFLRGAGGIPIHRRQDGPATPGGNESAFAATHDALAEGRVVGIFPEGQNAPERHVRDLKTGAARIALGAEAAAGWTLGVELVPIGLNYEERDQFLSRVLVRFGEPLKAVDYREQYEADPREASRRMTDDLQIAMRAQAVHVNEEADTGLMHAIDELVGDDLREELIGSVDLRTLDKKLLQRLSGRGKKREDLESHRQLLQWIADAIEHYQREAPERLAALRGRVALYEDHLRQARLRHDFVERSPKTLSARWEGLKATVYAITIAPIAAYGMLHNFIPYEITRRFALGAKEDAIRSIRAVVGGFFFFSAAYALFFSLAWHAGASALVLAAYLATLPVSGVWASRYFQRLGRFRDRILVRTLFRTKGRLLKVLLAEREQLRGQIDAMRVEYEQLRRAELAAQELAE